MQSIVFHNIKHEAVVVFLSIGYRETAFAYAVSSAGVAHSVSKACGQGKLESCGCDPKSQRGNGGFGSSSTLVDWRWSGCSHNMDFGVKFSRFLLDSRQRGQDIHSRIHLHNSHVGRTVSLLLLCILWYSNSQICRLRFLLLFQATRKAKKEVLIPLKSQQFLINKAIKLLDPIMRNLSHKVHGRVKP